MAATVASQGIAGAPTSRLPPKAVAGICGSSSSSSPKTSNAKPSQVQNREEARTVVVDVRGLEPLTSALRTRRSPS